MGSARASAPSSPPPLEQLREAIRAAGLRCTGSRIAVLRLLHATKQPVSHNEVSRQLASLGFDHATLYRNLTDLCEARLAVRTDLGDHVWRFELVRAAPAHERLHPHFFCTDCGGVACLPEDSISFRPAPNAARALRRGGFAVQVQGRCDECQPPG